MLKYKVGDRVFIKPYKLMVEQYGTHPVPGGYPFFKNMEAGLQGKNRIVTIRECCDRYYYVARDSRQETWSGVYSYSWPIVTTIPITDEMIAGRAFDYGEEIEVSDDQRSWHKETFCGFVPEGKHPYCVKSKNGVLWLYRHVRPLKEEKLDINIEVTINGEKASLADISDETLQKARKKAKSATRP